MREYSKLDVTIANIPYFGMIILELTHGCSEGELNLTEEDTSSDPVGAIHHRIRLQEACDRRLAMVGDLVGVERFYR